MGQQTCMCCCCCCCELAMSSCGDGLRACRSVGPTSWS